MDARRIRRSSFLSTSAPPGPRTYKGHVFDVTWHIGAKSRTSQGKDKDVKTEENIILLPGGKRASQDQGGKGAKEVVHRQSARSLIGCFGFSLALFLIGSIIAWIYSPFAETAGDVEGVFFFGGIIPMLLGLPPDCWCHISGPDKQEDQKSGSETRFRAGQTGRKNSLQHYL